MVNDQHDVRYINITVVVHVSSFCIEVPWVPAQDIVNDQYCVGHVDLTIAVNVTHQHLRFFTLQHLDGHCLVLSVNVNIPNTSSWETNLSIASFCEVNPPIRTVVNLTLRHNCMTSECLIVTTNGRNHDLINPSILVTHRTNGNNVFTNIFTPFKRCSVVEIVLRITGLRVSTGYEETFIKFHSLP